MKLVGITRTLGKSSFLRSEATKQLGYAEFSTTNPDLGKSYQLLVAGGGAGGCAVAAKFAKKLGKGKVGIIEPSERHYNQSMFTLVGGGIRKLDETWKPTKSVLPKDGDWIQDKVAQFNPKSNSVVTEKGEEIKYDYLVVALGLVLDYHQIKGFKEALSMDPMVCSNYSPAMVERTYSAMQNFKSGNAVFTFPKTQLKCAGAPQKIAYLTEDYLRKAGKRDKAKIIYNTSLPCLYHVPRYADVLEEVCRKRDISFNINHNLIEIKPDKHEAVFELLDKPDETLTYKYHMLHVTPPMSTPDALKSSPLSDTAGYVTVDRFTMQHSKYPNVFSLGDCADVPTSKTAAAVGTQSGIVAKNLSLVIDGKQPTHKYNGYTSCPFITKKGACVMAEFDYDKIQLETFPINQARESYLLYHVKANAMPILYWNMLLKGRWSGPGVMRKILHLGLCR